MPSPRSVDTAAAATGDEALMLSYGAGEATAFDMLYARHKGGVYRYLLRHCGNAGTTDEMFQDVWMSVIRARASYTPTAKFTTWLYRIAHNRIVDHWRAQGQVELVRAGGDDDDDGQDGGVLATIPAARGDEPDVRAASREIAARLSTALAALPPPQRDAFLLQQEAGLSLAEIAELTGAGAETVKSRLRYAIAKLRSELADLQ
jgi:RNA polymerase sigma-70 factor (ECF subfamily)